MTLDFQSVSAFVGILIGLGYLFEYLEKTVRDNAREDLVNWLNRVGKRSFSDALSSCSRMFLRTFDHIYARRESTFASDVWFWLTSMFVVSLTMVPFCRLFGLQALSFPIVLALGAITGFWLSLIPIPPKTMRWLPVGLRAGLLCILVVPFRILVLKVHQQPFFSLRELYFYGYVGLLLASAGLLFFRLRSVLMWVSPFRAMLTSIAVMLLIGLLKWDMVRAFTADINLYGWSIAGYLLLNVCVDSFSLLETRFVLKLASLGSFVRFFGVIIFDILASATIFLAIPIASGNFGVFLEAILFQGDRPWIGILFWSSFSTSVFFYLYLVSAGALAALQAFVKGFLRLDHFLPISEKPFRCLGLVAMVITTLIFLVLCCIL